MVRVAIVGSGLLGTVITNSILRRPQHSLIVLSRRPRPDLVERGVEVAVVDYSDVNSIVNALKGVHTVISVVFGYNPEAFVASHKPLIEAAKVAGVQRFAPSEFVARHELNEWVELYKPKNEIWQLVKESGLKYTAFRPGIYMTFLAYGSPKPGLIDKAYDGVGYAPFGINLGSPGGKVLVPGTGNEKINMTLPKDIGEFVAESLDIEWEEDSGMAGSVVTYNEVIKLWEDTTGKKLEVNYVSTEELEKLANEESDKIAKFTKQLELAIAQGQFYIEPTLSERTTHKPVTAREFIREWWGPDN